MKKVTWLISVMLFLTLAGCDRRESVAPNSVRVQLWTEPVSLDPALAEDGVSLRVLGNLMDGLVGYDAQGNLVHRLAESHELSSDGRRYTFKLRQGIRWSDGKPVLAKDFVTGLRRSLDPKTGSKLAALLAPIRGAKDFQSGKAGAQVLGVLADHHRLIIELAEPAPYFIYALGLSVALPSRQDILEANGGKWPPKFGDAPVTGPYKVKSHLADQRLVLERNPAYWRGPEGPDQVDFVVVSDESTAVNLFERGRLDIITRIPSTEFQRFKKKGWVRTDPYPATYYIAFNTRKPPFNSRDWRRAVSGAIQREELTTALETGETPARSWVARGLEGFIEWQDPSTVFADSLVRAKKAAAGAKPIAAGFDSSSRNATVMEKIQADVKKNLGLSLSLSNLDWKSHIKALQTDPPQIYRFAWLAPFPDPIPHLQVFTGGNPNNYTGWRNAHYDELVSEVARMRSGLERTRKIRQAQRILVDDEAAVAPVYHYVQNHAVGERVEKFAVNPFGVIRFDEIRMKK